MPPVRRPEGDPFPVYDKGDDRFTLEVIHGGFFVGCGNNRAYVDGTKVFYDDCDCDTWSALWLEDIIENLGYEAAGRIDVYWLLPGMQINEDGLRLIENDKDALSMVSKVKDGHKFLMLYLDHEPARKQNVWDDVVANPVVHLPPVISPMKKSTSVSNAIVEVPGPNRRSNRQVAQEDDGDSGTDSDSDYEPEIIDSDNDIEEGDDDLYLQYADHDPMDDKKVIPEGEMSDDEFFEPAGSDDESGRFKNFKPFVAEDMHDPKFHNGQLFQSVDQLKKAIREHSCRHRKNIKFPKNDKMRVLAKCEEGCPWELYASVDSRTKAVMVKRLTDKHTCESKWQVRAFSARYIGNYYVEEIRANEKMTLKGLGQIVQRDWKMTPKRGKLGRARKFAFETIYGDETAQYNQLWDFGQELRRSNPGSTFFLLLDDAGHFKRCYFSFDACKRGFLTGCRPIIFLDGCHLKTKFGGILLTAIGMDPNDCIFPVAFAIVEVENTSSWKWFLTALKQDLGIVNTAPWTIMSDKQKGLIKAVTELFPAAGHRFCVRHLWQNFNKNFKGEVLKNQLWKCARSSTVSKWQENMDTMLVLSKTAHDWLEELEPSTWVRAFQSEFPKCDVLLNNNCEVFNKYILEARELPVVLSALLDERASSQTEQTQFTPLPDSTFIQQNVLNQMPVQSTTVTKEINLQRKRQVLAAAKLKAAAERRDIADQAKFDAAMEKLEQEELQRTEAIEKKKADALAKKLASEEKKKAEREAQKLAAEEKKLALAEKKKKAQEEKFALAEKKKLAQEARKKEAEEAKHALAEKKRLAMEAKRKEIEEAKRKEEEETRSRLNNAIAQKMQREEEARQKAWEEHLQKQEMARQQALRDSHDNAEAERILAWKEKKRLAEAANMAEVAQFRAAQQAGMLASEKNKRKWGHGSSTNMAPYKIPRKSSMFEYLKGPPPGLGSGSGDGSGDV